MRVLKFGGSSLADSHCIEQVAKIIQNRVENLDFVAVVVSAMAGVTDRLHKIASIAARGEVGYKKHFLAYKENDLSVIRALFSGDTLKEVEEKISDLHHTLENLLYGIYLVWEVSPRTLDYVLSFGERTSAWIVSSYLKTIGIEAMKLDARDIIKTDKRFGSARVDFDLTYKKIQSHFSGHKSVQIVTGFISSARGGLTTTLGRGGSDFTAALIGAALQVEIVEIWSDVDGVLTADPRRVEKALSIPKMTYAEAVEMSHFGAKVIYPPTIHPAMDRGIPLLIKNTFNPRHPGTLISADSSEDKKAVKGISSISDITLLTLQGSGLFGVPGIAGRLFRSLSEANINVILITQGSSEHSISFAVQPENTAKAKKQVEHEFSLEISRGTVEPLKAETNLTTIAIIGENMRFTPGIAGKMLTALGNNGINAIAIAQGSSELNISVVVNRENEKKALNVLHEAFFLSDTKVIHLFMVGVGLIGSTLLKQLLDQAQFLKEKRFLEIKVVGLANTKKMLFDKDGIDLTNWQVLLKNAASKSDIDQYIRKMKELNLSNSVFVDNTADLMIPEHYASILDASISISTPNKVATSSEFQRYLQLQEYAEKKNVYFGYETNVGAGLPVISTLRNLVDSGDQVLKIEAVLSGSLSYIFNHFDANQTFSESVKKAGELGYTEPDPRDDLSGLDVKRKILILAREAGLPMEAQEIFVDNILPDYCLAAKTKEDLRKALERADTYFEEMRENAEKEGKRLRMIAKLQYGKASIRLQSVDRSSPFYHLNGSDNMLVFTTERYKDRPLVIQGPGAGAEVTAAGVFAELIHIGNLL